MLFAHAQATPRLTILNRTRIDTFDQDDSGVTARGVNLDGGEALEIRCDYLVGCDGARSMVRGKIGAKLQGTAVVGRVQSTYLRAPRLAWSVAAQAGLGHLCAESAALWQRVRH